MDDRQIIGERHLSFSEPLNSTNNSAIKPSLDNIHDLQVMMLQKSLTTEDLHAIMIEEATGVEPQHAMVPLQPDAVEITTMVCASKNEHALDIQLNIPLKSPIQVLHELVTHNVAPVEI